MASGFDYLNFLRCHLKIDFLRVCQLLVVYQNIAREFASRLILVGKHEVPCHAEAPDKSTPSATIVHKLFEYSRMCFTICLPFVKQLSRANKNSHL